MNIYSIKEIVKATNDFLKPKTEKNKNIKTKEIKLPVKTENIIKQAEKSLLQKKIKITNWKAH